MTASLTVLGGPLAGAHVDIEDSADDVLVGSDPGCHLPLDVPGVSLIHARLTIDKAGLAVHDTKSARGLYLNDARVEGEAMVRDGDILWLGPPGDDTSVMIQCRVAASAEPATAAAAAAEGDHFVLAEAAPAEPVDPMADLDGLFAAAPPEASAGAMPAAPAEAGSDDVFFMEEPPPIPTAAAPPPPPPPPPPAPEPPPDDLFFVEEPAPAAVVPPPAAAPAAAAAMPPRPVPPPVPPARPVAPVAPVAPPAAATPPAPPAAPPPAAPAAKAAARPVRRHVQSMPSAALESEEDEPAPRPRSAPAPRAARAPPRARRGSPPWALIAVAAAVVVVAAGAGVALMSKRAPTIASISPPRVGLGQSVTIAGAHFGATPQANVVQFGGKPGRVVAASETRLQVEIPELAAVSGHDTAVPVVVVVDGHESKPATVGVFEAPRIHGIAPAVAMPGDEVALAGAGWGAGAKVQFGAVAATVLDSTAASLKVTVPALEGAPGTEFPVTVTMGADTSNPAPFLLGRLPLLLSVTPKSASPGDVLTLAGRGFDPNPAANDVRVGGARALVAASTGAELKVVVPRTAAGEAAVDVRVPGIENVGQSRINVAAWPDPVDLRFVAEPFEDAPGHDHAQIATGLGPAFVLTGGNGRPVAPRALEAERRLNEAAATIKATVDADFRARGLEGSPMLVLAGKDAPLLEITLDDAAGYEEDWTGLKGRGGAVTPARIAVWWEAVARDLVLLLVRGDKPHFAADLAPEGRVFADLSALARKSVTAGVPRQVIAEARPPLRDGLRTAALRVPASVKGPAAPAATTAAAAAESAAPAVAPLKLDGKWSGSETESGNTHYITVHFAGAGGSLTVERALSITTPVTAVAAQKGVVHFLLQTGAGPRYYQARWDGQKLTGTVASDPSSHDVVGTFELTPG